MLEEWDKSLLCWFNGFHSPIGDTFWWYASGMFTWFPLYFIIILLMYRRYNSLKGIIVLLVIIGIGVGLTDFICSGILKPMVGRVRPCSDPDIACAIHTVRGYCSGAPSFASSHAGNSACIATFTLLLLGHGKNYWLLGLAVITYWLLHSVSRVYLGVHYPLDIIGGTLIGVAVAISFTRLSKRFRPGFS